MAYGWLTHQQIERDAEDSYVLPGAHRAEIRRDLRRLLGGIKPSQTLDAAARLTSFNRPVLIAWSADRFFPLEHAERLARLLPDARLEWIEARTFSPEFARAARRADAEFVEAPRVSAERVAAAERRAGGR